MEEFIRQCCMMSGLLLSVFLGFAIGFERKMRFKEAGIRTHTIVSIGSCLYMLISPTVQSNLNSFRSSIACLKPGCTNGSPPLKTIESTKCALSLMRFFMSVHGSPSLAKVCCRCLL